MRLFRTAAALLIAGVGLYSGWGLDLFARMSPLMVRILSIDPQATSVGWHCDWDYATGDSAAAVFGRATGTSNDYSKCWKFNSSILPNANLIGVISRDSAAALGCTFPSGGDGNVLRITWNENHPGSPTVSADSIGPGTPSENVAAIAVGSTAYWRLYHCNDFEIGHSVNMHTPNAGYGGNGTSCPGAGGCYLMWQVFSQLQADGSYHVETQVMPNIANAGLGSGRWAPVDDWGSGLIGARVRNQTYREEYAWTREATDSVRMRARIYRLDGATETLIADQTDFWCLDTGGTACNDRFGTSRMGDNRFRPSSTAAGVVRMLTSVEIGNNGTESGDPSTSQSIYYFGFAHAVKADSTSFIGPYPQGDEGN